MLVVDVDHACCVALRVAGTLDESSGRCSCVEGGSVCVCNGREVLEKVSKQTACASETVDVKEVSSGGRR